jgi:hypothetical protein
MGQQRLLEQIGAQGGQCARGCGLVLGSSNAVLVQNGSAGMIAVCRTCAKGPIWQPRASYA